MIENDESPGDQSRAIAPAECPNRSANPFADSAEEWNSAGFGALWLPPRSKKIRYRGFTGYDGMNASYADLIAWRDYNPPGNIAGRLPRTGVGVDVDDYSGKYGARTVAEHEASLGALPATYSITSRAADGPSRIRLYRVPTGTHLVDKLPGGGVELIQWCHRYVMLPRSIHPEGRIYHGYLADGTLDDTAQDPATFAELPAAWIEALSTPEPARGDIDPQHAAGIVAAAHTPGDRSPLVAEHLSRILANLKAAAA